MFWRIELVKWDEEVERYKKQYLYYKTEQEAREAYNSLASNSRNLVFLAEVPKDDLKRIMTVKEYEEFFEVTV